MKVLINAGPWLPVPPTGYGGIENVVATLIPPLRRMGVRVVLATVGQSTIEVDEVLRVYDEGQFPHLQEPYNQVMGIAHAHQAALVAELRRRDDIDLVHDHLEVVGPAVLSALGGPPVLHTLHWDLRKHPDFYGSFPRDISVNGVSNSQLSRAPARLRAASLGAVHLATPLADAPPLDVPRGEHVIVMGRICPMKGQHIAARVCRDLGLPLVMAGPVCGLNTPEELNAVPGRPGPPAQRARRPPLPRRARRAVPRRRPDPVDRRGRRRGARPPVRLGARRAVPHPVGRARRHRRRGGARAGRPAGGAAARRAPRDHRARAYGAAGRHRGGAGWPAGPRGRDRPRGVPPRGQDPLLPHVMAQRYLDLYERTLTRARRRAKPPLRSIAGGGMASVAAARAR
ncbi:glycosyltransferase [Thermocatellispora tengchongensis]